MILVIVKDSVVFALRNVTTISEESDGVVATVHNELGEAKQYLLNNYTKLIVKGE